MIEQVLANVIRNLEWRLLPFNDIVFDEFLHGLKLFLGPRKIDPRIFKESCTNSCCHDEKGDDLGDSPNSKSTDKCSEKAFGSH